jgi:S-adenosylmethionine decarboxylase proenzyme
MRAALTSIDTTIIDETVHRFAPEGVTALFLLAESHASLHTYPAQGAAFFDIFTCGSSDPKKAMRALEQTLQPTFKNCTYITRGEDQ